MAIWGFSKWPRPPSWIWPNRKWRRWIRRPRKPHPRTKHEGDRMTRCWVMAIWSLPKCEWALRSVGRSYRGSSICILLTLISYTPLSLRYERSTQGVKTSTNALARKLPTSCSSDGIGCEVVNGKPALTHVLHEIARTIVQEERQFLVVLPMCRELNVQLDVPAVMTAIKCIQAAAAPVHNMYRVGGKKTGPFLMTMRFSFLTSSARILLHHFRRRYVITSFMMTSQLRHHCVAMW